MLQPKARCRRAHDHCGPPRLGLRVSPTPARSLAMRLDLFAAIVSGPSSHKLAHDFVVFLCEENKTPTELN